MKHSKQYMVIFNKWSKYKFHEDKTEYDALKEANEEVALLEEMYRDTPRPQLRKYHYDKKSKNICDYEWASIDAEEYFWGYVLIDFEEEKILKWGHDGLNGLNKETDIRKLKDEFFRKEDEIPKDYKWDVGEYDGWLQFRWGNGRNSVALGENAVVDCKGNKCQCVRRCNVRKKKKYHNFIYDESEELALDKLSEEILAESKI